jgi:hypothetical protein
MQHNGPDIPLDCAAHNDPAGRLLRWPARIEDADTGRSGYPIFALPSVSVMVLPGPVRVKLMIGVTSPQLANFGTV